MDRSRALRCALLFAGLTACASLGIPPAFAVNEPVLTSTAPKAGGFASPAAAATITATFDRDIAPPPETAFTLRESSGGLVSGTVRLQSARTAAFSPDSALPEGSFTASVTARSAIAGDPRTSTFAFTVDATPPASPQVVYPPNGTLTNQTPIFVQGFAEAASTLLVTDRGRTVATLAVPNNGQYALDIAIAGAEDGVAHDFNFTATDRAGNRGPALVHRIVYDNVAPAHPTMSVIVDGSRVAVSGTAEPGIMIAVYRCILNGYLNPADFGTVYADAAGKWSLETELEDGLHNLVASAIDNAWNGAPTGKQVLIDTLVPVAPVISTPALGAQISTAATAITGRAEPGTVVGVREGTSSLGSATANPAGDWSLSVALQDGLHSIEAVARDAGGNLSAPSQSRSFAVEIDVTPPSLDITTADRTVFLPGRSFDVSGSARDNREVRDVQIQVYDATGKRIANGSASLAVPAGAASAWTIRLALPAGAYQIRAVALDAAGLRSPVLTRTYFVTA